MIPSHQRFAASVVSSGLPDYRERGAMPVTTTMKQHGPLLGQIYVQVSYGVMYLITRVAFTQGMSHYIFVVLRQAVATVAITPTALFLERSTLTLRNLGQIFLLALLGVTISQNFYYAGLACTSSTLASTMNNLSPAATFLTAVLLRLENVDLRSMRGQAKVLGTILCVGGSMVMVLLKGPVMMTSFLRTDYHQQPSTGQWIVGALLLAAGVWAWCACVIYQALILEEIPSQLTLSAVMCWMGTLQSLVVALLFEKPSAWKLDWNLQLLSVVYSGTFCSAFGLFVQMWCVKQRGPVFATIFSPLSTVLVAIVEPWLLHVPLHWGSLVGMVVVIGGLYCALWGKALDMTIIANSNGGRTQSISAEAENSVIEPLLATSTEQSKNLGSCNP